jgi:glycerol kinase
VARFILALDQGTTSSRSILFDRTGTPVATAQREYTQHFPQSGWVEHDAEDIWNSQSQTIEDVLAAARTSPADIAAIGIANQRETTLVWSRRTGKPLARAIVWQDRRTAEHCERLKAAGHEPEITKRTGLVLDPYFSGTKLAWLLDNVPDSRKLAESGELAFGTVDSWLVWKLTGGAHHVTDATNASRTLLFNVHTREWDPVLLAMFRVPPRCLPHLLPSQIPQPSDLTARIGGHTIPIAGIAGDQQAALFGQCCFTPGMAKNTYGTGCFLLMNTGENALTSRHRLITTVAWQREQQTSYALEGSVFVAGAAVQWLRDGLGIIKESAEIEALAASVPDNGGVHFVPAFTGLGSPHWDPHARGTVVGISRGTTRAHIARAALEAIAFQSAELLSVMQRDARALIELRVDGGATANDLLMQFQADVLGVPVVRPRITETTALGAAYLAGLGVAFWSSLDELARNWQVGRRFEPRMSRDEATARRHRWSLAVERSRGWADVP